MKKRPFLWILIIFFVLNIFNTYFLTVSVLNQYIIPFQHTFLSELFSFLGNFAILAIFFLIGVLIFKKPKRVSIYLLCVTFLLNIAIIALQYYSKGYRLAFSVFNFSLMKNPTGGFGGNVFLDWVYELFLYYRVLALFPFVFMLVLTIVFRKDFADVRIRLSFKKVFCSVLLCIACCVGSYQYYQYSFRKNWGFSTDYAQYGVQYAGAYNYYLSEFIFRIDNRPIDRTADLRKKENDLLEYNKNKSSYVNAIDQKVYSNQDKQTGILKGKNIFVIQMESTMGFCFNQSYNGVEVTPYFNQLFKEQNCFYFNKAYTTVGIGNTSDAEFAFFTGMYPVGDMTIAWEYDAYDFGISNLGNHLKDYLKYSYNGTNESFYNHDNLHEGLYNITSFRGLETFENDFPREQYADRYLNYWIRDTAILEWARQTHSSAMQLGKNAFSFVETITPHNPFYDLSKEQPGYQIYDFGIGSTYYQLTNYMNQVKYNDKILYDFIKDVTNPESSNYLEDTIFVIYGDHGNALYKGAYESLLGRELEDLEYRRLLLNIPIIIYDPTGTIYNSLEEGSKDWILQQTKSNTDMYRTLLNLLGIETDSPYFGVNMFSGEPSYSYDPKNVDILTDEFMYCMKNEEYQLFNSGKLDEELIDHIMDYRKKQDDYLNTLVYTSMKKKK